MSREAKLAQVLVELADNLVADFDIVDLLIRLIDGCIDVLEISAAGIMLAGPDGSPRVMASSSETMRLLELFELQSNEGPCFDCFQNGQVVVSSDLQAEVERWPTFTPEALTSGFVSAHALPMRLRDSVVGALNLFHAAPGHLSKADLDVAQAFADIATIAILQHQAALEAKVLNEQLNHALNSRIVIEQAKGVISERENVDMDAAFSRLRSHARNRNQRIAGVAGAIVDGTTSPSELDVLPKSR